MREIIKGQYYRHFKKKYYKIICIAKHTESNEKLVIYQALYGNNTISARPFDMFVSKVDRNKYPDVEQEYRFEKVEYKEVQDNIYK
ncbi:DUF1653 domain-containing protein [Peptostreptococcus equinus]|uniref:DUF1653 domain-containing protein n=1 Tax=Peptostreptococcus equinus TaxID=3003601 RepID=A0ABY7JVK8_9FIRM|nr:DUF1653 domain-containing protein [Peptostreptococcus sp. CBA3647]WAW15742.1 DUF1653 domain-containing protein [Peptostreptococcus sp. CBA3647]